ncbi:MAG: GDSL-like Lipase/Acylhydrolase [Fibrobacteres bacterium]|nr:GDSL-like Lipase/Acylhydrolase [Fibrobacterota bacterium]
MSRITVTLSTLCIFAAASLITGCFESASDNHPDRGPVTYVAVGNSLTAGFQSGGLRADWQQASYPALLARQIGVPDFQLPLLDSPGVGRKKIAGMTTIPLFLDSTGITTKLLDKPVAQIASNGRLDRPYNNLAVPGATTRDFIYAYDSTSSESGNNGYFNIVLRGGLFNNTSMLRQAIKLQPTLMTMWIGNNDILGGIIDGDVREGVTVTPIAVYTDLMDRALDTLLRETSAHIFLANIPSIITIPYVTAVPKYIFDPKTFLPAIDTNVRFLTEEANVKYVLLPALGEIAKKNGIPKALGGTDSVLAANLTLTEAEAATADKLTVGYNAYLAAKVNANPDRLTLLDVNALLTGLNNGAVPGLSSKFALFDPLHSAFSLDGIHPNSKGYKEVANYFLSVINKTLGTSYPKAP